ncbi:MAG: archaeal proteasome endopeptidase complex subunit beta [Candidatus Odinarchaeia archaeon]
MDYTNIINSMEKLSTGTTTVGIRCKDGVVLATDKRATAQYLVATKNAQKIYVLDEHLAATIAGSVADAQKMMDTITAEAKLFRLRNDKPMRVKAASRLLANILFQSRIMPYLLQLIVGGVDDTGPRLFVLDLFGSLTEEKFVSTGSGSPIAFGVLEDKYHDEIKLNEAIPIAIRAVKSAISRDVATGDGVDVIKITKQGVTKLSKDEIEKIA